MTERTVTADPGGATPGGALAALTPAGERVAADLERSHQAYQERLLDGVTAQEQQIVLRVLRRVRANVTEQENP